MAAKVFNRYWSCRHPIGNHMAPTSTSRCDSIVSSISPTNSPSEIILVWILSNRQGIVPHDSPSSSRPWRLQSYPQSHVNAILESMPCPPCARRPDPTLRKVTTSATQCQTSRCSLQQISPAISSHLVPGRMKPRVCL